MLSVFIEFKLNYQNINFIDYNCHNMDTLVVGGRKGLYGLGDFFFLLEYLVPNKHLYYIFSTKIIFKRKFIKLFNILHKKTN